MRQTGRVYFGIIAFFEVPATLMSVVRGEWFLVVLFGAAATAALVGAWRPWGRG